MISRDSTEHGEAGRVGQARHRSSEQPDQETSGGRPAHLSHRDRGLKLGVSFGNVRPADRPGTRDMQATSKNTAATPQMNVTTYSCARVSSPSP
jgi:hypothetical protein